MPYDSNINQGDDSISHIDAEKLEFVDIETARQLATCHNGLDTLSAGVSSGRHAPRTRQLQTVLAPKPWSSHRTLLMLDLQTVNTLQDYITFLHLQLESVYQCIRHAAHSSFEDKDVLDLCGKKLEEKVSLEAKLTLYEGHLKIGQMIAGGNYDGTLSYFAQEDEDTLGAWHFNIPRPTDWKPKR